VNQFCEWQRYRSYAAIYTGESGSPALIAMVQTTDLWNGNDFACGL
jgi:hypothetical protein